MKALCAVAAEIQAAKNQTEPKIGPISQDNQASSPSSQISREVNAVRVLYESWRQDRIVRDDIARKANKIIKTINLDVQNGALGKVKKLEKLAKSACAPSKLLLVLAYYYIKGSSANKIRRNYKKVTLYFQRFMKRWDFCISNQSSMRRLVKCIYIQADILNKDEIRHLCLEALGRNRDTLEFFISTKGVEVDNTLEKKRLKK